MLNSCLNNLFQGQQKSDVIWKIFNCLINHEEHEEVITQEIEESDLAGEALAKTLMSILLNLYRVCPQ